VGVSRHVYAAVKKCLEFLTKSRQRVSIANVDRQRVPDIRSGHTECSLSCLGQHPGNRQLQSISGPQ